MRKRILVTGGAGFLGSHLCERLLNLGHEVVCLDNFFTAQRRNIEHLLGDSRFELVRHDVTQPITIEVDQIFHLACPASPVHYQRNPVRTIRTAVQGTLNMLDMAREVHAPIMIASTSEIYGDPKEHPQVEPYWGHVNPIMIASTSEIYGDPKEHPQVEPYWGHVNPIGPRACYDEGKRCAETLTVAYATQYRVKTRIARIFNTYGPRMHENDGRVVSNFVLQALRNEPITMYGDGAQTRSFCFCSDLIEGFIRLINLPEDPGPVNLGNPRESTIKELAEIIVKLTGSKSELRFDPLPVDDPTRRCPDISKAKRLLDWEPKVKLEDGLSQTIQYMRDVVMAERESA